MRTICALVASLCFAGGVMGQECVQVYVGAKWTSPNVFGGFQAVAGETITGSIWIEQADCVTSCYWPCVLWARDKDENTIALSDDDSQLCPGDRRELEFSIVVPSQPGITQMVDAFAATNRTWDHRGLPALSVVQPDVNGDGVVDLKDLQIVKDHLGK